MHPDHLELVSHYLVGQVKRLDLKTVMVALTTIWLFLAPVQKAILATLGLVFTDFVFGVSAARKQNIAITSTGLKSSVVKLLVYLSTIIVAYIAEKYLLDGVHLSNLVSTYIGITEVVSINENLEVLSGTNLLVGLISKIKNLQK